MLFVVRGYRRDRGCGRLASLSCNAFFYQSEWGGGKKGGRGGVQPAAPVLAQRAVADSPRWTRALRIIRLPAPGEAGSKEGGKGDPENPHKRNVLVRWSG